MYSRVKENKDLRQIVIYIIAFFVMFGVFRVIEAVRAGSLTPSAAPAATMQSAENIYNAVAGTYDASGVSADANGSIMEQLKAIKNGFGL